MKIIGFSGKKQSGKDTAVNNLYELLLTGSWSWSSVQLIYFAYFLKTIVKKCFDSDYAWGTDEDKNKILSCGKSTRELLQYLGTDIMRTLDPDCWIRAYKATLAEFPDNTFILTGDVRFPNEVRCIQELGGHVIRFLRSPFNDNHKSEMVLDGVEYDTAHSIAKNLGNSSEVILFDAIIDNTEMSITEQNEAVWKLVNEREWL